MIKTIHKTSYTEARNSDPDSHSLRVGQTKRYTTLESGGLHHLICARADVLKSNREGGSWPLCHYGLSSIPSEKV